MIRFPCPSCDTSLKTADEKAGSQILCPACGDRVRVPAAPRASAAVKKPVLRDSRRDDDDDDEQEPKSRTGVYIGLGAVACLLVAGVAVVVGMNLLGDEEKSSDTKKEPTPQVATNNTSSGTPSNPVNLVPSIPPSNPQTVPQIPTPASQNPPVNPSTTAPTLPTTTAPPKTGDGKPTETVATDVPPAKDTGDAGTFTAFDPEQIYQRLLKSTTWIVTEIPPRSMSYGSGSLVDKKNRLILTNHHVVIDALTGRHPMSIFFAEYDAKGELISQKDHYLTGLKNQKGIPGRVVHFDQKRDLALVQLVAVPDGVLELPLAAKSPGQGQAVLSVGNPNVGALWVISKGTVRQVVQDKWVAGGAGGALLYEAKVVLTDSPTNPGDSGGPLVNSRKEMVAVVHGGNRTMQNMSKFIDITEVRSLLNEYYKKNNLPLLSDKPNTAVAEIGNTTDVQGLVKHLGAGASANRARAAFHLGQIGPEARLAVGPLVNALKDADADVRKNAAEALVQIGALTQSHLPTLIEAVKDPEKDVQLAAIGAIKTMGAEAEKAVPVLREVLKHKEEAVRKKAATALANLGPAAKDAVPDLAAALKDSSPGVRSEAALALGKMGGEAAPALKELGEAIKDNQSEVRVSALTAIEALGPEAKPLLPVLEKRLADKDKDVRLHIIAALGAMGPEAKGLVPNIIEAMEVEDFHRAAKEALVKIGAADALAPLIKALRSGQPKIRLGAVLTLGEFRAEAKKALPELNRLIQVEKDEKVKRVATIARLRITSNK